MFNKILVVCVGNICRSPTAERVLQQLKPHLTVASAGVGALVGHSADAMALEVAQQYGVSLQDHQAQQLTRELCSQYDLILVMEQKHLEAVSRIAPEARGKTMLLGQWQQQTEIPDPYRQSKEAFEFAYKLIQQSCQAWASKL